MNDVFLGVRKYDKKGSGVTTSCHRSVLNTVPMCVAWYPDLRVLLEVSSRSMNTLVFSLFPVFARCVRFFLLSLCF